VYGLLLACIIARPLHASSDLNALYQQWLQVQVEQGEEIQAQTYQQLFSQAEQLRQDYANVAESPFLDPYVFFGNTYAELGSLYFRTPSWPFSFGSEKMAEKLFYKDIYILIHGVW
jgi:protein-disulfide isomerase